MDIEWLVKTGPCAKFLGGQVLSGFAGDNPDQRVMYLLIGGSVDVYVTENGGDTRLLGQVPTHRAFGGEAFFTGKTDFVYIADTDAYVYVITEESYTSLAKARPDIALEILRAAYLGLEPDPMESARKQPSQSAQGATAQVKPPAEKPPAEKPPAEKPPAEEAPAAPPMKIAKNGIFPDGHKGYPGIMHPEFKKILFDKEYTCPFCKKKFPEYKVARSKLYAAEPMRFDLRKGYRDFKPEWYDIITCRHCLFSTYYTYFENPKPLLKQKIEEDLLEAQKTTAIDFDRERDLDFVFAQHYLALICGGGYISTAKQIFARAWGSISWLYEDAGDKEMEKMAANRAAEAYTEMYSNNPLTPVQEQVTCMTIAGMLYRAGVIEDVKKYLFTVKTIKGGDRAYVKLAEDMVEQLRIEG